MLNVRVLQGYEMTDSKDVEVEKLFSEGAEKIKKIKELLESQEEKIKELEKRLEELEKKKD